MKYLRKSIQLILKKPIVTVILLIFQIIFFWLISSYFYNEMLWIFLATELLAMILVIHIINDESNSSYKISWIILILWMPPFGSLLFLFFRSQRLHGKIDKSISLLTKHSSEYIKRDPKLYDRLKQENLDLYYLSNYLEKNTVAQIYSNSTANYFKSGKLIFDDMLKELEAAKEFIFLEYFIIGQGYMWESILNILEKKASEGLEVRVMYDGTNGIGGNLPQNYNKILEAKGIKSSVFIELSPILYPYYNNRDHRKILVIDGKVAYTGGINLSDEYINRKQKYGYWKDTGIKIEGSAVNLFTMMFLQMWNRVKLNFDDFKTFNRDYKIKSDAYILAFGTTPINKVSESANTYLDMINRAKKSIRIMTPYFIVGEAFLDSLSLAAKKGVEVSIILPKIQDKKIAKLLAQTYYERLIESGVNIFEFSPGFIHAKSISIDAKEAIIGTINFDFRSLYLNFECAVYLYKSKAIKQYEEDFAETLKESILIKDIKKISKFELAIGKILKIFSPLM